MFILKKQIVLIILPTKFALSKTNSAEGMFNKGQTK